METILAMFSRVLATLSEEHLACNISYGRGSKRGCCQYPLRALANWRVVAPRPAAGPRGLVSVHTRFFLNKPDEGSGWRSPSDARKSSLQTRVRPVDLNLLVR
jgi:hypothetical protein